MVSHLLQFVYQPHVGCGWYCHLPAATCSFSPGLQWWGCFSICQVTLMLSYLFCWLRSCSRSVSAHSLCPGLLIMCQRGASLCEWGTRPLMLLSLTHSILSLCLLALYTRSSQMIVQGWRGISDGLLSEYKAPLDRFVVLWNHYLNHNHHLWAGWVEERTEMTDSTGTPKLRKRGEWADSFLWNTQNRQCAQRQAGDVLPVCASECHLLCCGLMWDQHHRNWSRLSQWGTGDH